MVLQADLHQADRILDDPSVRALVDFDQPVCLLLVAMLHFIPDSPELHAALRRYRDALAPGSLLAVSHGTAGARTDRLEDLADLYVRTGTPLVLRDRAAILGLFDGWELLDPGLVHAAAVAPRPRATRRSRTRTPTPASAAVGVRT